MYITVKNWMNQNRMVKTGDTVICAVSGGVDSIVLLHIMNALSKNLGIKVKAAHFNHCIRGEESDRDENFVRDYCKQHNIEFYHYSGDVPGYAKKIGTSVEAAARDLRYKFLDRLADKYNAKIATAHHADDNLETILINMVHGTSPIGLCGIPPVRGNIIRPLLCLSRSDIEKYAERFNLDHVEDSTNSCDDYLRNRIRHNITPLLRAENPNIAKGMVKTSTLLREDMETIAKKQAAIHKKALCKDGTFDTAVLNRYPKNVVRRIINDELVSICSNITTQNIEDVMKCIASPKSSYTVNLSNGVVAKKSFDRLYIGVDRTPSSIESKEIIINGAIPIGDTGKILVCKIIDSIDRISKSPYILHISKGAVTGKLSIRSPMDGDKLRMPYGTKRLSKLFNEAGISEDDRHKYPVIVDETGIVAVYGIGIDMTYAVSVGEETIEIRIERDKA